MPVNTTTKHSAIAAAFAALLLTATAPHTNAAIITVLEDNGNTVTDFSTPGQISYDVDWVNNLSITFLVTIEDGDTEFLAFSGLHLNDSDSPFTSFQLDLPVGLIWHEVNQIRLPDDVSLTSLDQSDRSVILTFDPSLNDRETLIVGSPDNPLADPLTDWLIRIENFQALTTPPINPSDDPSGDPADDPFTFRIEVTPDPPANNSTGGTSNPPTISIPEPTTVSLLALTAAATLRRRRTA